MKINQKIIKENNRQVEIKGIWLLYNFERYIDYFWTQKEAWNQANKNNFGRDDTKLIYQVLRGDLKLKIYEKRN